MEFTHAHHQEAARKTGEARNVDFPPELVAMCDQSLANTPEKGLQR